MGRVNLSNCNMIYLLVLSIVLSETIAISFLKKFSLTANWLFFALGLVFYTLVSVLLIKSFKYEEMGIVNVLWSALSVLMVVGSGVIFFKEHVTLFEGVGILFVVLGVLILRFYN